MPDQTTASAPFPPLYGVYPAVVVDVHDPDAQGRVKIESPIVKQSDGVWARVATFMAGARRGAWFIPEPNDEVVVAFYDGDPRRPIVIGALWNGSAPPPEAIDATNDRRSITSRAGHKLLFDDTPGRTNVVLKTSSGHRVALDDSPGGSVTLAHAGGSSITLRADGTVAVNASSLVTIDAPEVTVNAGLMRVNAGMAAFTGTVQADTIITNSVVASSYTPGAGNIW